MKISLLNAKITIEKSKADVDSVGNHKNVWNKYFSCFATVSSESPSEITSAGVVVDNSSIDFTVRWCSKIAAVNSTEYRVIYTDDIYSITGIDHMNFKHKSVKLKCKRVRN